MKKGLMIDFGLGGHGIEFGAHSRLSGYENPESFQERYAKGDYKEYDLGGAVVIDKRIPVTERPSLALSMPMVNVDLPKGETEPFTDKARESARYMIPGLGGSFQTLALLAQDKTYSGLDYVSLDIYASLWRKAGARIGRFTGGRIVWINGNPPPPPPPCVQTLLF